MTKYSVGGRALKNGIVFESNNYKVTTTYGKGEDIDIEIIEYEGKKHWTSNVVGIPFIRPYIFFFLLMKDNWKNMIKITLLSIILLTLFATVMISSGNTSVIESEHSGIYTNLVLLLLLAVGFRFTDIAKYHGAEHMAISTLENKLDITEENIAKQSRIHRNCGTNLVVFIFLVKYPLEFLGVHPLLSLLISISVGFELFLLRDGMLYKLLTPIYYIGYTLQKYLLTAKPNDKHLEVAEVGMNELKQLEGWK